MQQPKKKSRALTKLLGLLHRILLKERNTSTRMRRYVLTGVLLLSLIWLAVGAYSLLSPKNYTSEMTLILPGARSSSVFSLDSIGQANTQTDSPFSSITSTPKIIYQSIALSDEVLGAVAAKLGMELTDLAKPRIDLIDETSLMVFKVYAGKAEAAQHRAQVVLEVFLAKLDDLRRDEVEKRAQSIRQSLADVEKNLKKARGDILDFQQDSDLVTSEQIKSVANQVEELRGRVEQVHADGERVNGERERLAEILGISPAEAAIALRFQDDPRYASLLKERTDAMTALATNEQKWGPNHPLALSWHARFVAADMAVRQLASGDLGPAAQMTLDQFLTTSKDRAELFRKLVELDSQYDGLKSNLAALRASLKHQQDDLGNRSGKAARLADLERNHKIAEAVFSSALARVDTGREDIFGSYPLVQVMSPPTLPSKPTSPQPKIAAIGGGVASLLVLIGVWLAWIRQPFLRKHLTVS